MFDTVAAAHVNVDTIIQNTVHGKAEMSVSVPAEDVPAARAAIEQTKAELGAFSVEEDHGLGKVSLIGAGMRSHPGVAAKMFRTLAAEGINLADDLDLADPDLLHDRPRPRSPTRCACCTPCSSSTAGRSPSRGPDGIRPARTARIRGVRCREQGCTRPRRTRG